MKKKYIVTLTDEEQRILREMLSRGKAAARKLMHARILLKANAGPGGPNWSDAAIAEGLEVGRATVERVRKRFVEEGFEASLQRRKPLRAEAGRGWRSASDRVGVQPGSGRSQSVDRAIVGGSHGGLGVRGRRLQRHRGADAKKNELKPWLKKAWCIPPKANAEFVWKMEDVLEVYKRPYDPKRPVVCLDETSKQLIGEVRTPIPAAPGQVAQYDYEYVRNGVANIFMIFEPLAGQRAVEVTERRTRKDYAECLRTISDEMYAAAEVIVLVQDNLNTHSPASLYETFEPAEAKRIADRFELHYTPKHGSWLDMAEIELGILGRQCLSRRIENIEHLRRESKAWEAQRDTAHTKVNWRFTTRDARIKLKRLYPLVE